MNIRPALSELLSDTGMLSVAGVGAAAAPQSILDDMALIGKTLANRDIVCVSGGTEGPDQHFIRGVASVASGLCNIYLPWYQYGLSGRPSACQIHVLNDQERGYEETAKLAESCHSAWETLSDGAKRLMVRHVYIMKNSDAVIAWADHTAKGYGGTGHLLRVATKLQVPWWDIANDDDHFEVMAWIKSDIERQVPMLHLPVRQEDKSSQPTELFCEDDER